MRTLRKLLAVLLLPALAFAQTPYTQRVVTLASSFDLDGEAADDDQVVVSATITDSTSYTIAANPDVCRLVDVTVTDADSSITAGTLTVVGTDCWGYPLTATFALAGGSGVRTGTVTDTGGAASPKKASGAYFATVTSVSNGVVTGEGVGDALKVGYTSNSAKSWPMYGKLTTTPSGRRWVDVFGKYQVNVLVKNGAATTDVIAVSAATTAPFENVTAGDMLFFNLSGEVFMRRVATKTDADTITVNQGITIPAAGVNFYYQKRWFLADPEDGWIPVAGYDVVTFGIQVDANVNTGGVVTSIECAVFGAEDPATPDYIIEEDTATVASTATGSDTTTIDLRLKPHYTHCRAGVKFGTGDDADAANEDIDIVVGFRK